MDNHKSDKKEGIAWEFGIGFNRNGNQNFYIFAIDLRCFWWEFFYDSSRTINQFFYFIFR